MAQVIEFPPKETCPRCLIPLRPATRDEIRADLNGDRYRHMAENAAQGDRDFDSSEAYPDWMVDRQEWNVRPPWLLRCDTCGMRVIWTRQEEL